VEQNEAESRKYNVLIVGTGGQGAFADEPSGENSAKIISFAHAFKLHPGFSNPILYDIDPVKAEKAAKTWNTHKTDDYIFALGFQRFDVAVVATPDDTHYEILKTFAKYPIKLVICEKPLCCDLQEAREIVETYRAKNIPLMVNYTRRFTPKYQELKRFYDMGAYGKVLSANLVFNRGWIHSATHGIDLFNWFFGDGIKPKIEYVGFEVPRRWLLNICFEKYFWSETRQNDQPVSGIFDNTMWYLAENAYNFLEGREPIRCTGEDGLFALEKCFGLTEKNENS
jgi:predicted dehydrogenase